jgi:demethylmenaquinone methyltransferase/2-methoxy-6-polyprenyl-1,4-benzoquinol methylase
VWDSDALQSPHRQDDKAARVEAMFNRIAPTYELVNRVSTFGMDARWRRRTIRAAELAGGETVLDICCGTGDLVRGFAAYKPSPGAVIGVDFAANMLASGQYDGPAAPIQLIRADGLHLPIADASVDVTSCAFGVRNFQDLDAGLREMHRVLKPGGRTLILEFTLPASRLLRWAYMLYAGRIMPWFASAIARDSSGAYRYLPRSIATFAPTEQITRKLLAAGFATVDTQGMNFGGVTLYRARKAGA